MWNLKIPKRMFFYWGARDLPFLRYMSVYSFQKLNPDWEVKYYMPIKVSRHQPWPDKQFESRKNRCKDYTNYLSRLNIKPTIFDFEAIGLSNDLNEIHKSDLLRYELLAQQGGAWADMDILFTKPMDQLLCNKQKSAATAFYYHGREDGVDTGNPKNHAIGFLMSSSNNKYFTDVAKVAKQNFLAKKRARKGYQCVGADLLNRHFPLDQIRKHYPGTVSVGKEAVYAINDLSTIYDVSDFSLLTDNSIGIHWYGGCERVKQMLLGVTHTNYRDYPNRGTLMTALRKTFPNL